MWFTVNRTHRELESRNFSRDEFQFLRSPRNVRLPLSIEFLSGRSAGIGEVNGSRKTMLEHLLFSSCLEKEIERERAWNPLRVVWTVITVNSPPFFPCNLLILSRWILRTRCNGCIRWSLHAKVLQLKLFRILMLDMFKLSSKKMSNVDVSGFFNTSSKIVPTINYIQLWYNNYIIINKTSYNICIWRKYEL